MDFSSLPDEYQALLNAAQDGHDLQLTPLQALSGGRTGALLYLVSAARQEPPPVQHFILKLDRVKPDKRSEEIQRHGHAQQHAPAEFVRRHMAQLALTIEHETAVALFYNIAGESLLRYRPLSNYERQDQLEALFRSVHEIILTEWNSDASFKPGIHPRSLLERWLGYRITPRGNLIPFFEETLSIPHLSPSLLIDGQVYPNPLAFCLDQDLWGKARLLDSVHGYQHGDLNVANVLASFSSQRNRPDGLYLIDFALYKAGMPLCYDLAYLEMSYLLERLGSSRFLRWWQFLQSFSSTDLPDARAAAVELAGPAAVVSAGRSAFKRWVEKDYLSLQDDLWGQYWLAAAAVGLNYANKPLQTQERLAGLLFACVHLKRFCAQFGIPLSSDVAAIDIQQSGKVVTAAPRPQTKPPAAMPAVLPSPTDAFVGRQQELAELQTLLLRPEVRLVTMTGPGGAGKTRLALQVGQALQPHFADGAVFVPLAEIREPGLLVNRIAGQLGLREGGGLSLLDTLNSYLSGRQMLLILDNFEQILEAAPLAAGLLQSAPGIKILVTSRVLLNLRSEHPYDVPALSLPAAGDVPDTQTALESDAVQLFAARARAANHRFSLDEKNTAAVVAICRRLEGLPLAIELAAARTRLLPPPALLARLENRLGMLTGGARDLPDRHRTLRAAIDWSFDLLEPAHKTLFTRLSIFVGGFALEAAEAACSLEGDLDVLIGVEALVNSSLLRMEDTPVGPRFTMLEVIHEYALDRLESSGEMDAVRGRHAGYYAEIMKRLSDFSADFTNEMESWLDWIAYEHENLREVLRWFQERPEDLQQAVMLILGMSWYWYRRGHLTDGRAWSQWALEALGPAPSVLSGMMHSVHSIMATHQGDLAAADASIEQQLGIGYGLENDVLVGIGLFMKGMVLHQRGKHDVAFTTLQEARDVISGLKMDWWNVDAALTQATAALGMGDLEGALRLVQEADAISSRTDSDWMRAFTLNLYGDVQRLQGDFAAAAHSYREGEMLLRRSGDRGGELPRIIHSLGYTALHLGHLDEAQERFSESLEIFRSIGSQRGIAECLAGLAVLLALRGSFEPAAVLLGAASAALGRFGGRWWPADKAEIDWALARLKDALAPDAYGRAWERGAQMSLEAAVAFSKKEQGA
jgi:predicted ATPase